MTDDPCSDLPRIYWWWVRNWPLLAYLGNVILDVVEDSNRERVMTVEEIEADGIKKQVIYKAASALRKLLDEAEKEYGEDWDTDDAETEIINLVTD